MATINYQPQYRVTGTSTWTNWGGVTTTLSAAISSASATTLTVASATSFPTSSFIIQIDAELLQVTGGFGTTTWTVLRGYDGTIAATHLNGAAVASFSEVASSPTTITGLTSGTSYDFQVISDNGFGQTVSSIVTTSTVSSATIATLSLSNLTFPNGAASGTGVGTISATLSDGTSTGFTFTVGSATVTGESAPGATCTPGTGSIVCSNTPGTPGIGNTWTISTGGVIALNGVVQTGTASVTQLYIINHSVYQLGNGNWFGPMSSTTTGSSILSASPVVVNSNLFALSGSNILVTNDVYPASLANSYYISITASYTGLASITNNYTITSVSTSTIPLTPPTNLPSGWQVVFFDDFLSQSTITTSSTATSGYNWYYSSSPPSAATVYSGSGANSTAALVSNGNTSGGANASSAGGVLMINGNSNNGYNANIFTCVDANPAQNDPSTADNGGTPCTGVNGKPNYWKHAYFEAYMQWNANGSPSGGWFPAFWSWTVTPPNPHYVEIDFIEQYQPPVPNKANWDIYDPGGGNQANERGSYTTPSNWTSEWHTIGCLWQSTGTNTGTISIYYDDVQVGSTLTTGTGNTVPDLESVVGQYISLGTGYNWPMYVDWVRVWQAPAAALAISVPAANATEPANSTYTVSGTITGYSSAPTLQYQVTNNGTAGGWVAVPSAGVSSTVFSFTAPAITSGSTNVTVSVRDANTTTVTATSGTYSIVVTGTIFTVSNSQIYTPTGTVFYGRGINLADWAAVQGGTGTSNGVLLQTMLPQCNLIRLNCQSNSGITHDSSGYNVAASAFSTFIQNYTGYNTAGTKVGTTYGAVIVDDHKYSVNPTMPTGAAATNQVTWFQEWATFYLNNPYVWYSPTNEPWGADTAANVCQNQLNCYNAVRGTGNNNPIMIGISTQWGPGIWNSTNKSYFSNMTNVAWDVHIYEINNNVAVSQDTANSLLVTQLSSIQNCGITSKDGIMPVIMGEYGPANFTESTANDGIATCVAVWNNTAHSGSTAWWFNGDAPFNLSTGATLTNYGSAYKLFTQGTPPTTFAWVQGTNY